MFVDRRIRQMHKFVMNVFQRKFVGGEPDQAFLVDKNGQRLNIGY